MAQGTRAPLLCNRISGMSLLMFYTVECQYCHILLSVFRQLPRMTFECQIGIVNMSAQENMQLGAASLNSATPITEVPYVILYIDGKPFLKYDGPRDMEHLCRFINEVRHNINKQQQFLQRTTPGHQMNRQVQNNQLPPHLRVQQQLHEQNPGRTIPEYSLGMPKCKDGVCYLTYTNEQGYFNKDHNK